MNLDSDSAGFAQGAPNGPAKLLAELRYDSGVAIGAQLMGSPDRAGLDTLRALLDHHGLSVKPRFALPRKVLLRRATSPVAELSDLPSSERASYAHAGFLEIDVPNKRDRDEISSRIRENSAVWRVEWSPCPVPASAGWEGITGRDRRSRNLEPAQGYLHSSPWGMGLAAAWRRRGGRGAGVTVCDVEANWNRSHGDLPRGIPLLGGRPLADDHWRQHGTAVLGILAAQSGASGLRGACDQATVQVHSSWYGDDFNVARALVSAADHLERGDILLLEVQARGPALRYVPMHWWDDTHSALLSVVERGIVVVQVAGNGGVDFDSAPFEDSNLTKDTGSILVGAAIPPTNLYDVDGSYEVIGVPDSPMPFSNRGERIALRGWGWHVTSLGYGDAQGGSPDRWLTLRFAGTSSAAAMVAGAAVCIQGIARKRGRSLTPTELRSLLVRTGHPPPEGSRIGAFPDIPRAVTAVEELVA